jgi:hypothetical protein
MQIAIPQTIKRYANKTLRFERIGDEKKGQINNTRKRIKRIKLNSIFKTILFATFMALIHLFR